ncbi:MAG: hypothetical protein JWQ57_1410 [Mucilaginibacter sp.]|nr:hypothetical protein [Mucilaginibacter sp.]
MFHKIAIPRFTLKKWNTLKNAESKEYFFSGMAILRHPQFYNCFTATGNYRNRHFFKKHYLC